MKTFRLPHFKLVCRDLTDDEHDANLSGIFEGRDYIAVDIYAKGETKPLTCCVGSPVIMMRGEEWNELEAARSALSFASEPSCWDDEWEAEWSRDHGENLTNEAFCHRTLGKELRQ